LAPPSAHRDDAFEYLANARAAWTSANEEAAIAVTDPFAIGVPGDEETEDADYEEEKIEEEPLSQLVDRGADQFFEAADVFDHGCRQLRPRARASGVFLMNSMTKRISAPPL
jgi:hypothetical protein